MADDVDQQIDQAGTKALFRAKDIGGKKHPFAVLTDPADGAAIKPASQADVEEVRDRLPAGGAASDAGLAAIITELGGKATGAKQDTGNASLATLVATMAAVAAAVATETTLAAINAKTPALSGGKVPVTDPAALPLPAGAATETTVAAVLAKIIAAPATEAKQDTGNTSLSSIVSALAALIKVGVRRDTDTSPLADGEAGALFTDELGRLKTSTYPASQSEASGAITASGQQVALDVSRTSNVTFGLTGASLSGHNATFEASLNSTNGTDGTWYAMQAIRSNANTIELTTGVLAATPAYMWEASVNGYKWFRVRATAHTGGTATYVIRPAPFATEPIPAAQVSGTQPVSGTVTVSSTTANIGTSGITTYTDSATVLAAGATFTGTTRDAGATVAYNMFCAHAFADQAGTLRVEKSTDGTTWRLAKAVALAAGEGQELVVRVTARYYRAVFINGATLQTAFSLTSSYQRI